MAGEAAGFLGSIVIRGLDGDVALVDATGALKVSSAGGSDGAILDGATATTKATVVLGATTDPVAGNNPLLTAFGAYQDFDTGAGTVLHGMAGIALPGAGGPVIGGTETNPVVAKPPTDYSLAVAADEYSPGDITPGAKNVLMTSAVISGASEGLDTAIRMASVLDGIGSKEGEGDNPLLVRSASRTSALVAGNDGAAQAIAATTAVTVAPANADRMFLSIKNDSGTDMTMAFGRAAGATDVELGDGESFTMEAGNGIYTGDVSIYNPSAGSLNVNVIEY